MINSKRPTSYSRAQNRDQESESKANVKAQVDTVVGVEKGKKENHVLLLELTWLLAFVSYPP